MDNYTVFKQIMLDFAYELDVLGIKPIRASVTVPSVDYLPPEAMTAIPLMYLGIKINVDGRLPHWFMAFETNEKLTLVDLITGAYRDL